MSRAPAPAARKAPAEEPFVLAAMLSLTGASLWLALRPGLLLQFYYSPEMLALTHLFTLGFVTALIMGILLRLSPLALGVTPRSRRTAQLQCALFLVGASGMVIHFARATWVGLAWATLLVLAATLLQAWNLRDVFARARQGDWPARFVAAALVNLVLAASLGTSFGMLRAHGFGAAWLAAPLLDRLAAHLLLAALGWITTLILGLQLKLLPATAGARRWLPLRFWLLQGGLLLCVTSLLTGGPGRALGAGAMALALVLHALPGLAAFSLRRDDLWEFVALALLVVLAAAGLALALDLPDPAGPLRLRAQFACVFVALFGWILLTIGSTAFKLFPRWVWEERFAAERATRPVPTVTALFSPRLRHASGALLTAGVLTTAAGMLADAELPVRVGTWALFGGALAFVLNVGRTARWALLRLEWKPPDAPAP